VISLLLLSLSALAENKVVIIDTGLDLNDARFKPVLCSSGHKNESYDTHITDYHGHGTHIAGIIAQQAEEADYCLVIVKYYSQSPKAANFITAALKYAVSLEDVKIINISAGGSDMDLDERDYILHNPNIIFNVAAGNNAKKLDPCDYYPACYNFPNMNVIGNLAPSSNYGSIVRAVERGQNVFSTAPGGGYATHSGTSQATAIYTGKMVRKLFSKSNPNRQ
jgi:subtilisin family serine protease